MNIRVISFKMSSGNIRGIIVIVLVILISIYLSSYIMGKIHISNNIFSYVSPYMKKEKQKTSITRYIKKYSIISREYYDISSSNDENIEGYNLNGESGYIDQENAKGGDYTSDNGKVQNIRVGGIDIINQSYRKDIDYKSLLKSNIKLDRNLNKILIYNTHTSESYTPGGVYNYSLTDTYRIQNPEYNMLRVSKELYNTLSKNNYSVVFDNTPHDYSDYNTSYSNSKNTIERNIAKYGGFGFVIDIHRDAMGSNLAFRPVTVIENKTTAKIMLVVGIGTEKNPNPYWQDNLMLALKLQEIGNELYPGLFRNILVRNSVYNQNITKNSILVEIGATGNYLDEAINSAQYFEKIIEKIYN